MKRTSMMMAVAVIVSLATLGCATSRQSSIGGAKEGKALVKSLPAAIEGVELLGAAVRAKAGYQWVKQPDGSFTVARMAGGGLGNGGTWNCTCKTGPYECTGQMTSDGYLRCVSRDCLSCELIVKTDGLTARIIAY